LATDVGARRGCLAIASLSFLAVAAPVVAWRQYRALRRRGDRVLLAFGRMAFGDLGRLRCELDVPSSRLPEIVEALSGVVAEAAATVGLTLGCVGVVPDEEPVLVALAPQRDLVARRVRGTLGAGEAHRHPQLWLTLRHGTYLAQVVDPYLPFKASEAAILALLRGERVAHVLLTEVVPGPVSTLIALSLYAPRPVLRAFFTMARRALGDLSGWSAAR
jgi:hypothetical protein